MENVLQLIEKDLYQNCRSYLPGEVVCRQGDPSHTLYIFVSGKVDVFVDKYKVATITEPLTPLGELSMLTKRPRTATVQAVEETTICLLDDETFSRYFKNLPDFFQKILNNLAQAFLGKESNLLAMMAELEERVRLRTEKLHQANEELKELNEFKDTMIGMAAHDLRNPLNVINGYLSIILKLFRDQIPEKPLTYLERCQSVTRNTCVMLDSLLDVNMIDSGKIVLDLEPVELPRILANTLEMKEIFARRKNISIQYAEPSESYRSRVDPRRVAQVLENLFSNAIKYSPADSIISLDFAADDTYNLLSIRDEGPGISSEEQNKIFTPFYRTANQPTAGEHSTGLGLLIVKKIVDLHQGVLLLESEAGRGSTFTVGFRKEP